MAHFSIDNAAVLQPLANQIRAQVGYGDLNRRGWNASFGFSYDVKQQLLQNQLMQVSYNGSCCGIAFEYRRLSLGPIRTENQFRVALIIANIGTFGNLRRQERFSNGHLESASLSSSEPAKKQHNDQGRLLAFATIEELAALLAKRKISPVELTEMFLRRIERLQSLTQRVSDGHGRARAGRRAPRGKRIGPQPPVQQWKSSAPRNSHHAQRQPLDARHPDHGRIQNAARFRPAGGRNRRAETGSRRRHSAGQDEYA